MRAIPLLLPALVSMLVPVAAAAQKPQFLVAAPDATPLNQADIDDDKIIYQNWSVTFLAPGGSEFEIRYGSVGTSSVTNELVSLETGLNEGTIVVGTQLSFSIGAQSLMRGVDLKADGAGNRPILIRVFNASNPQDEDRADTYTIDYPYDAVPPPAPTNVLAVPGEKRLHVTWTAPEDLDDVESYTVAWRPSVADCTRTVTATSVEFTDFATGISKSQTDYSIETGLSNEVCAAVAVRAVDLAGNEGPLSEVVLAAPVDVLDFWELYKDKGGTEDGGFCFVATAAHGSYAAPTVRILRAFRDRVLARTPLGKALVWLYYRLSPPLAARVASDPDLATVVRVALVPAALLAALWTLAPLAGLALAGFFFARRRRRWAAALAGVAIAIAVPTSAGAAEDDRPFAWGVELKGGPFAPAIGPSDTDGGKIAFNKAFGSHATVNPLYSIGVDLSLYRRFGHLGIGGSFGFMQFVGDTLYPTGTDEPEDAGTTTVFNIAPMSLTAFYRFTVLADEFGVPLAPYVRGGLAYYLWWVTDATGDVSRYDGADVAKVADDVIGRGGKFGLTGTAGVALMLDVIEPRAARRLETTTGIRNTYLFFEYRAAMVDGFGSDGFDLSDDNWSLGFYLEF